MTKTTTTNVTANMTAELVLTVPEHALCQNARNSRFIDVVIPCEESLDGYASFSVYAERIRSFQEGYKSVLLGKPETARPVNVCTAHADEEKEAEKFPAHGKIHMSNAEIYASANIAYCAAYLAA